MKKRIITVVSAVLLTLGVAAPAFAAHQGTPGFDAGCTALELSPAAVDCGDSQR